MDSTPIDQSVRGRDAKTTDDDLDYVQNGLGDDLDTMLVYNLLRTHSHLAPFLDADLRERDLSGAQFNALLLLRKAGRDGLLMNEIGQKLVVTKSNITGLVDRLERQGLVERAEHSDRRATIVRITRAGQLMLDRTGPRHTALLTELTNCLSDREKKTLVRLLSTLRRELRRRKGAA